jgi:hypothetical protein
MMVIIDILGIALLVLVIVCMLPEGTSRWHKKRYK